MTQRSFKTIQTMTLISLIALAVSGCATMKKKFSGSESVNMTPFAENTLLLLSELDYGLPPEDMAVVQKYVDIQDPDAIELQSLVQIQRIFLKGIVEYSVKIVNLNQSIEGEEAQAKAYHEYLSNIVDWFVKTGQDRGSPSRSEYKVVLEKIEKTEDLLSALRVAQPLIARFNEINLALAREIANVKGRVVEKTMARVEKEYQGTLALALSVHHEKEILAQTLKQSVDKNEEAGIKQKTRRYAEAHELALLVGTDVKAYLEARTLIGRVVKNHDDMVRRGGKTIYLWTNAHRKMALGIKNPAEWFPLTDIKALVGTASKGVVPF